MKCNHALQCLAFSRTISECDAAFTPSAFCFCSLTSAAKFDDRHSLVKFVNGSENLAHELARGIIATEIGFSDRDKLESVAVQIVKNGLLNHQVACQSFKRFH